MIVNLARFPEDVDAARGALGESIGGNRFARFVVVGRVGESAISDDVHVVEEKPATRRLMRRIFPSVAKDGAWRKSLAHALPLLGSPPRGVPRLLEIGVDAEERLCLVFEEHRPLPGWLALPRNFAEAARLAVDAGAVARAVADGLGGVGGALRPEQVEVVDGEVLLRGAGVPEPGRGDVEVDDVTTAVCQLAAAWGFPAPRYLGDARAAYDLIARSAAPNLPWRTRPPGIADARRALDALSDSDVDEIERVRAALVLSRAKGLDDEVVRLLVRTLNEPLAWLPRLALELLTEWPEPFGVRIDGNGLLRRCPHPWAATEIVSELGGTGVERHCADCDARVVLPQSLGALADRCEAARALVDVDECEAVDVVEAYRRRPLWRGEALAIDGALDLVNVGHGRLCLRRRALPGDVEVQPFRAGARLRVGNHSYSHTGSEIVVEYLAP